MAGINKVILVGNLGQNPELRYTPNGIAVCTLRIATSESYTDRASGERITNTEWHNAVVRNKAAEICEKYLKKGDRVYVEGRIKTRKWQGDDGKDRYSTEIHVDDFTFLTQRPSDGITTQTQAAQQQSSQPSQPAQPTQANQPASDDDLPF